MHTFPGLSILFLTFSLIRSIIFVIKWDYNKESSQVYSITSWNRFKLQPESYFIFT